MLIDGARPVTVESMKWWRIFRSMVKRPLALGRTDMPSPTLNPHMSGVSSPSGTSSTKISRYFSYGAEAME